MFERVCSLQGRRVRGLVTWAFHEEEGFEIWARRLDSKSKGSRFGCPGFSLTPKSSRFGRACSIRGRRVRGLDA